MLSVVPVVLKNLNPCSSISLDSSDPRVLKRTLISEVDFLIAENITLIDVAGFSSAILFVI